MVYYLPFIIAHFYDLLTTSSLKEQIRFLKKTETKVKSKYTLEEVRKLTSSSKSNWADDIIKERQERG